MVGLMWLKLGPPSQGTPPFDRGGWVLSPWAATVPVSLWLPLGRPASTNFQSEVCSIPLQTEVPA